MGAGARLELFAALLTPAQGLGPGGQLSLGLRQISRACSMSGSEAATLDLQRLMRPCLETPPSLGISAVACSVAPLGASRPTAALPFAATFGGD